MPFHRTVKKCLLALLFCSYAKAATLPSGLTAEDVGALTFELGTSGAARLLRSAEPYPKFFPGLKFGVSFDLIFPGALRTLGSQNGNVPDFIPQPRFYLSKALFFDTEIILNFFPSSIMSTLGSTGGILKWSFLNEAHDKLSGAAFVGVTSIEGFNNTFSGTTWEGGVVASKDFVRFRPYVGASFMLISGSVPSAYAATSEKAASTWAVHSFAGCEFNLPIDIAVQLDLFNLSPRAGVFFGKRL